MLILEVSKKTHWGTKTVRSTILITGGNKFAVSSIQRCGQISRKRPAKKIILKENVEGRYERPFSCKEQKTKIRRRIPASTKNLNKAEARKPRKTKMHRNNMVQNNYTKSKNPDFLLSLLFLNCSSVSVGRVQVNKKRKSLANHMKINDIHALFHPSTQ